MVKHEDVDEENAQENFYYNMADTEDSSEVPGREESDDNNGKNKLICADSTIFEALATGAYLARVLWDMGALAPAFFYILLLLGPPAMEKILSTLSTRNIKILNTPQNHARIVKM